VKLPGALGPTLPIARLVVLPAVITDEFQTAGPRPTASRAVTAAARAP
jgi:hypothetical protein